MSCAPFGGARLATDDQHLTTAYQNFGLYLGYAFQIRDDYLNLWGKQERVGKDQYSDLRSKKKPLPVVYALAALDGEPGQHLRAIYANTDQAMQPEEMRYVLDVLTELDAREHIVGLIDGYIAEALGWLECTGLANDAQAQLAGLARFVAGRDH